MNSTRKKLNHQHNASIPVVGGGPDRRDLIHNARKQPVSGSAAGRPQAGPPIRTILRQPPFSQPYAFAVTRSGYFADTRESCQGGTRCCVVRPIADRSARFRTVNTRGWNMVRIQDVR